jgi:hypothetical protein
MHKAGVKWALVAILVAVSGCSNDVELPSAYHQDILAQPQIVAVDVEGEILRVTWETTATANTIGFVVSFTDAEGREETRFIEDPQARSHSEESLDLSVGALYGIVVWAVGPEAFFGPRSNVHDLLVE